ncbi:hypothetical protein BH23ACT11_BH23ACT11_28200 [soil metagenome]
MKSNKRTRRFRVDEHLLLVGGVLAALLWVVVAVVNAFVFGKGSLLFTLFPTRPEELLDRGLLVVALLIFIAYVQHAMRRRRREEEQRLRLAAIVESSEDAITSTTMHGTIVSWNPGAEKLYGYTGAEAIGRPISMLVPPDRIEERPDLYEAVEAGEVVTNYETVRVTKEGRLIDISLSLSRVEGPDGDLMGVASIARDITERKEYEKELERSNDELQQFAYVASHDLQEPLRMISSYMQLLERRYKDQLDDTAREFIGYAVDGANRMQQLINDLLKYSRVGTRGGEPEPIDLSAVFEAALANLKVAVEDSGAEVTAEDLPTVMGDQTQLLQLFQNLIANSMKFRREGVSPKVRVGAERRDGEWLISISDNGIGINPDDAERIFHIFERLHSREEYEGTGIGLAVCKRIVERHGGSIWVEPGEGTTFYFTLPATDG